MKPKPRAYFITSYCYGKSFNEDDPNCKIYDLRDKCRAECGK